MTKYIGSRQGYEQVHLSSLYGVLRMPNCLEEPDSFQGNYLGHNQPQNEESKNVESKLLGFSCIYKQMPSYKDFIKYTIEHTGKHQIDMYIIGTL